MPVEIETKIPVVDLDSIHQSILELGGRYRKEGGGVLFQKNTFLDTPGRRLEKNDELLRVREVREDDGDGERITASVTWKGPRETRDDVFKSRPEVETEVSDPEGAVRLLRVLGFSLVVEVFEKRIIHLSLDEVDVDLNEVPYLGGFIELEGSEEAIGRVVGRLGLSLSQATADRYEEILAEKFGDRVDLEDFTFSAAEELKAA